MEVLRFFESIRSPFLDSLVAVLTELGGETMFIVLGLIVLWCVSKRSGYYMLTVGYSGIILSQFMKILFRIPRPWVQDPAFTIVESAREGAGGYSFPSGHTTNMTCLAGSIAMISRRRWIKWVCFAAILLVGFSRMYLGVHTPLDVGVAIGMSAILVLAIDRLFYVIDRKPSLMYVLFAVVTAISAIYLVYTLAWPFPADVDMENLTGARENACSLLGAALGLAAAYILDDRYVRYSVTAVWWTQALKVVIGLAILLIVKSALKSPLNALLGDYAGRAARYFLMLLFTGGIWPMSFRFFAKLGGNKA